MCAVFRLVDPALFADRVSFADGTARVPVVRKIKVGKPTAPPPWHSLSGNTLGRSSTLAGLLAGYQLSLAPNSKRKPPTSGETTAIDPLDVSAKRFGVPDDLAGPTAVGRHKLAYFLLRRLDEQLLADEIRSITKTTLTALFGCLRRLIALCAFPYHSGTDDPQHVGVVALHAYGLLVALRSLRVAVVSSPAESTAFRTGERDEASDQDSDGVTESSSFVSQLNTLLAWPATHTVAQISVASVHEVIAETLSQGVLISR